MSDTVSITCHVAALHPVQSARLIALASVVLDLDGLQVTLHGVQVIRAQHEGLEATGVDLPRYRSSDGVWRQAVELPEALRSPIAEIVLEECLAAGLVTQSALAVAPR